MNDTNRVVLFDGPCNLCQNSVQFLIRIDRQERLRFAPLNSQFADTIGVSTSETAPSSVLYWRNGVLLKESRAAVWILFDLGFPWFLFGLVLFLVPSLIRNKIYQWIAKNRYSWFGKSESCWIMTSKLQNRFLN